MLKDGKARPIKTVYYRGREVVKTNHAKYAENAVPRCVFHMQENQYDAEVAEVYDEEDGTLYAVVKSTLLKGKRQIHILYKRGEDGLPE